MPRTKAESTKIPDIANAANFTIMIVDDEDGIRFGLRRILEREGYEVLDADTGDAAMEYIRKREIDMVLLDIRLHSTSGIDLLIDIKTYSADIQVIMVTGYGTIDSAVDAMKKGAADYILKPVEKQQILHSVALAMQKRQLEVQNSYLRDELVKKNYPGRLIARDSSMITLLATVDQIKESGCNIMLSGETGSGKEVIAQYIHYTGPRKNQNFVSVNCAALSEELILSELFGHVRGAFTGAVAHKNGKLELADRGTLFLDEIGEMPLSIQAKLLKVIEDRCFERVGGVKKIFVDLHLMTATNRDLQQMVRKGSFREDLYFRLKVMELHIPPLRERKADIDVLVDFFADKYAGQYNKHHLQFSREALDLMREYDWPGNVRELQNTVNRLVLLAKRPSIGKKELEELAGFINIPRKTPGSAAPVNGENPGSLPAELPGTGRETPPGPDRGTLQERLLPVTAWYEKHIILETLKKHGGNKTRAAEELGITRQTVLNKLRHYSLPT